MVSYVEVTAPDVVIHVGDLSLDGAHEADDLQHARRQLDSLPVAWHAVPGNHDIGDNPWPGAPGDSTVDVHRNQRWLDLVGADHWSLELDGWMLLAVNAQLFGSGLDAEVTQWEWLETQLQERDRDTPIALVSHKPVLAGSAELRSAPPYRFVPQPARRQLTGLLRDHHVALVLSGHVHQHRLFDLDGTRHVWAPTTWAVLPEEVQPTLGTKRCGIITVELDGDPRVEPQFVEPVGLAQFTLLRDIPDPYRH